MDFCGERRLRTTTRLMMMFWTLAREALNRSDRGAKISARR